MIFGDLLALKTIVLNKLLYCFTKNKTYYFSNCGKWLLPTASLLLPHYKTSHHGDRFEFRIFSNAWRPSGNRRGRKAYAATFDVWGIPNDS